MTERKPVDAVGPVKTIITALIECQKVVDHIEKTGTAPQVMGGFKFAEVGQVVAAARKAMIENGLVLTARVSADFLPKIDSQGISHVVYEFDLWHKSGACIQAVSSIYAHGGDRNSKGGWGDKGGNKASTAAQKYGIIRLFNIPTVQEGEWQEEDSDGKAMPETTPLASNAQGRRREQQQAPPQAAAPSPAPADGDRIVTKEDMKAHFVWKTAFAKANEFYTKEQMQADDRAKMYAMNWALDQMGLKSQNQLRLSRVQELLDTLQRCPKPVSQGSHQEEPDFEEDLI